MLGLRRFFGRKGLFGFKEFEFHDASRKPDRQLDWADPEDRAEGIMRASHKAAQEVARKVFDEFPPTLGILPRNEEMSAMMYSIKPMFIHIAMVHMYAVWDKKHKFVKLTAYRVANKHAREMHHRKIEILQRMYPLLRTMEEEAALEMIEKLLERFDTKLRIYDGSRTYERDPDRSTFHRMALHVASQFYMQRDRRVAQQKLVQIATREAGMFTRKM
ncbi:MAG TPA: hypothetical protein VGB82_08610 [Alphaproteobacteria bacterium]